MDIGDFLRASIDKMNEGEEVKFVKKRQLTESEEKEWLEYSKLVDVAFNMANKLRAMKRRFWASMELKERNYGRMRIKEGKDQSFLMIEKDD